MLPAVATSAQWPLQVALVDALLADATLTSVMGAGRVYSDLAPAGTPLDYVVVGDASEVPADTFGRAGHTGTTTLHVWAVDRGRAAAIHGHLARLLDRQRLMVAGHAHLIGRLSLVTSIPDADGQSHHRVLRYTTTTRVTL